MRIFGKKTLDRRLLLVIATLLAAAGHFAFQGSEAQRPFVVPAILIVLGIAMLMMSVGAYRSGIVEVRYRSSLKRFRRKQNPVAFWSDVGITLVVGVLMTAAGLYSLVLTS